MDERQNINRAEGDGEGPEGMEFLGELLKLTKRPPMS